MIGAYRHWVRGGRLSVFPRCVDRRHRLRQREQSSSDAYKKSVSWPPLVDDERRLYYLASSCHLVAFDAAKPLAPASKLTRPNRARQPDDEHAQLFVERYRWLRDWALRLSDGNHSDADDLVHEAFLQFVLRRRDLTEIGNVEGYLYGLLRRLRLSHARKALRRRQEPLIAADYDSAELCLRGADVRELLQMQQELFAVCDYACLRKQTSKAGSVLILRFFHGYYPTEIAHSRLVAAAGE